MLVMVVMVPLLLALSSNPGGVAVSYKNCPLAGKRPGSYSKLSIDLCFQDADSERRHLEIPSPDRSTLLVVKGHEAVFRKKGETIPASFLVGRSQEEVIWSPDSKALIVTLILGGAGPASSDVAFVEGDPFPERPSITDMIQQDFASGHKGDRCWEHANVGGLAWLGGSQQAVFVAEVPPSSQCEDSGGYFDVYVISIPQGRILKRYPMKEAVRKWRKLLGPELKDDIQVLHDK